MATLIPIDTPDGIEQSALCFLKVILFEASLPDDDTFIHVLNFKE